MAKPANTAPIFHRAPGNYDPVIAADECSITDYGPSKTVQADREDADINVILKRFGVTGHMPLNPRPILDSDFDHIYDYKSAMDAITQADSSFMSLPVEIRNRFENDPQKFMEYSSDPANLPGMREMGLTSAEYNERVGLENARRSSAPASAVPNGENVPSGSTAASTGSVPPGQANPSP